jgi:hypothetical protein
MDEIVAWPDPPPDRLDTSSQFPPARRPRRRVVSAIAAGALAIAAGGYLVVNAANDPLSSAQQGGVATTAIRVNATARAATPVTRDGIC